MTIINNFIGFMMLIKITKSSKVAENGTIIHSFKEGDEVVLNDIFAQRIIELEYGQPVKAIAKPKVQKKAVTKVDNKAITGTEENK